MRVGTIKRGTHKGATVQETDSMECPRFRGINDEVVTIVVISAHGEKGRLVAVKETEVRWW
jgi:hypothetical protein